VTEDANRMATNVKQMAIHAELLAKQAKEVIDETSELKTMASSWRNKVEKITDIQTGKRIRLDVSEDVTAPGYVTEMTRVQVEKKKEGK
jgi:hypothetical protein